MDRHIDLVMLSRFGRSDGGMETWAYGFIPSLLRSDKKNFLHVYGIEEKGQQNNVKQLLSAIDSDSRDRFQVTLYPCKKSRIPYFFQMFLQMKRAKFFDCPEIVLGVGGVFELLLLIFIKKYKKSKKILWLRTIFFNEKANRMPSFLLPILRRLEFFLLKKIDILIANGKDIADYYAKYGLNVTVIHNGIDITKWEGALPLLQPPISVAYIGRLAKVKGICEFLEAVRIIKSGSMAANFVFHVLGTGPFEKEAQVLASEQKLIYYGLVANNELPNMMAQFDVCVALTWAAEVDGGGGTSNALLEQMASGRVIVAWDNVIFRQVLNEDSGYLIKQGDAKAMVDAFYQILDDAMLAKSKAIAAKRIIANYSLEAQINKFNYFLL